jgi:toxin CcdB
MAQWDVYPNPAPASREEVPFVIDVQSDLLRQLPTRFVVPLALSRRPPLGLPPRLVPAFEVKGRTLHLLPQEEGAIPARLLRGAVTYVRGASHRIVDALDTVMTGV